MNGDLKTQSTHGPLSMKKFNGQVDLVDLKNSLSFPSLTLTMLWADSADDKLMIFFLYFLANRIWHFMQSVSSGDNLHEVSNPIF